MNVISCRIVQWILLFAVTVESDAFAPILTLQKSHVANHKFKPPLKLNSFKNLPSSLSVRGGNTLTENDSIRKTALSCTLVETVVTTLTSNSPFGILALSGIANTVLVPLTLIRQGYVFSVGYGFSVFAIALSIAKSFGLNPLSNPTTISLLCCAVAFYGVRLGGHLLLREFTVPEKRQQMLDFDKSPRLKRIPLALSTSLFYAFLTSPLLYAARVYTSTTHVMVSFITKIGLGLTWAGALMEALADLQKFIVKRNAPKDTFVGPTGGIYKLSRHPNYFAEVLFWFGLVVSCLPFFGKQYGAYVYASLGLYGIYSIMTNATKRLDGKQKDKYSGQDKFDEYIKNVKAPLWPWISWV